MIVLLRGRLDVLIFNQDAELAQRLAMSAARHLHRWVALDSQTRLPIKAFDAEAPRTPPRALRPPELSAWKAAQGQPA
jgi:hypothetical protein